MNIGLKRQVWGALGIGVALGATVGARREALETLPGVLPAAQAAPEAPSLRRVPLEGEDVALLLGLQAYKWDYSLPLAPKGRGISATYWIEDWRRNGNSPKIYSLGATGMMQPSGTLMIKMPRTPQEEFVIATTSVRFNGRIPDFTPIVGGFSGDSLDRRPISFERDIILSYKVHNASGQYTDRPESVPNYARSNDRTVYLKVRYTTQKAIKPVWKNGRIVLK